MSLGKPKDAAILFFARDFLSLESSKLGAALTDRTEKRVYIVTSDEEAQTVRSNDPNAEIFDLMSLMRDDTHLIKTPIWESEIIDFAFQRFNRDRYLIRESNSDIRKAGIGLHRLIYELNSVYHVTHYFDEPVSGVTNDVINCFVKQQGGKAIHFNFAWVPGYLFTVSGYGHDEPIPVNQVQNAHAIVSDHLQKRLNKQAIPSYVRNDKNTLKRFYVAASWYGRGLYRKIRKSDNYLNRNPWAQFFHARAIFGSIWQKKNGRDVLAPYSKRVILPLHYEPEAVINYFGNYLRQEELAAQLLDHMPAEAILVIKEHPSQMGATTHPKWDFLRRQKRVIMTRGDVGMDQVLDKQSIVVSIGSTAVLDALCYGFGVILIGNHHIKTMPSIASVENVSDIKWDWEAKDIEETRKKIVDYYADFLETYGFKGQILRGATDTSDLARLFNEGVL